MHSRAPLFAEPLAAAAIEWACALTATALSDGLPYPRLHAALSAVLDAVEAAPAARGWTAALARYELLVLAELGFGLDLSRCAATGLSDDLRYVSPRTGRAVSGEAGEAYRDRLLALPVFLGGVSAEGQPDNGIASGLALTGHFLAAQVFAPFNRPPPPARDRLVARLAMRGLAVFETPDDEVPAANGGTA